MNWRYLLARLKWSINIPAQIRAKERDRCIRVLCRHDAATVTATLYNGHLAEDWIRALLQPHTDER